MPTDVPKDTWHFLAVSNEFTGEKYFGGVGGGTLQFNWCPGRNGHFFFSDGVRNSKAEFALFVFVLPCTL